MTSKNLLIVLSRDYLVISTTFSRLFSHINTDLSELNASVTVSTAGTVAQTLAALISAMDYTKITPKSCIYLRGSGISVLQLAMLTPTRAYYHGTSAGSPHNSSRTVDLGQNNYAMSDKDISSGANVLRNSQPASDYFGSSITLYY